MLNTRRVSLCRLVRRRAFVIYLWKQCSQRVSQNLDKCQVVESWNCCCGSWPWISFTELHTYLKPKRFEVIGCENQIVFYFYFSGQPWLLFACRQFQQRASRWQVRGDTDGQGGFIQSKINYADYYTEGMCPIRKAVYILYYICNALVAT